jgi:hypothetical protein
MNAPQLRRQIPVLFACAGIAVTVTACGGDDLVGEAIANADAACACADFECTTEYVKWFNEVSITREDDLAALSDADRQTYLDNSLRAADCQNERR